MALFEDLFLNNLVTGLVRKEEYDGDSKQKVPSNANASSQGVKKKEFENNYGSEESYIRWHESLKKLQDIPTKKGEAHPAFVLPNNWYNSYHANLSNPKENLGNAATEEQEEELKKLKDVIKTSIDREDREKAGDMIAYKGIPVMPMRDLFISVPTIVRAFETKPTVNDALLHICDRINQDSHNIFNIKLSTNNDSKNKISFVDANLLSPQPKEKRLVFDVLGETSIVSNCDLKFVTPKAGLSSMIAISNLTEPTSFSQIELSSLNHLNLLNKPDGDKNYFIRSLPFKGDINSNIFETEYDFNMTAIENTTKNNPVIDGSKGNANENLTRLTEQLSIDEKKNVWGTVVEYGGKLFDVLKEKGKPYDPLGGSIQNSEDEDIIVKPAVKIEPDEGQEFVKDDKHAVLAEIRNTLYNRSGDNSVSPILPIELDLSIYGNKFLQIGDCYTISYLPEHYKDRTFFQIVGTEDRVDVNGWTTSYTSVMRVDSSTDKFMNSRITKTEIIIDPTSEYSKGLSGTGEEFTKDDVKADETPIEQKLQKLVNGVSSTKEKKLIALRTNYTQRSLGPSGAPDKYQPSAGRSGQPYADSLEYTYEWFKGPKGEEVERGIAGSGTGKSPYMHFYQYIDSDGNLVRYTYEDRKKDYKLPGDAKGIKVDGVYKFLKIGDQKIHGSVLSSSDESRYPNRGKRNVYKQHPAYGKYNKAYKSAHMTGKLSFKISSGYFSKATIEEIKQHPKLLYHSYRIDVTRLSIVENLAMMYAIRNAVFKNINFEGFKVVNEKEFPISPTSLDDLPHATVEYTDLRKMLRLHHLYKNNPNKTQGRGLTEVELALAKVLQNVVGKDNKNLETEELLNFRSTPTGIIVPSPIEKIQFRDNNEDHEDNSKKPGTPKAKTGSKIDYAEVADLATGFSIKEHPNNALINTLIRIPAYLLENSQTDIRAIAKDINDLYANYLKDISDQLSKITRT